MRRREPQGRPIRLVTVVSHPIQYYAPLHRALAAAPELDLLVLFASRIGLDVRRDLELGVELAWATDLTAGYAHRFLPGAERPRHAGFREIDNPGVWRALDEADPDVLLLHGYASITLLKALAWATLRRRPCLMMAEPSVEAHPGGLRRWVKRPLMRRLYSRYAAFLPLGDRSEAFLAGQGIATERLFRMPSMLDEQFWAARGDRPPRRARLRQAWGVTDGEVVFLYVGKLLERKRVGDAIAAVAAARPSTPVRLILAGDGEDRAALSAQATELGAPATFLGFTNLDVLPDVYAAADVLVHPASHEQFGMVVLEAAVTGLPLILSDRVGAIGPTSIARPGENAIVYPCGDVAALAAEIARLADDTALRARMAAASLALSQAHRGPESVAAVVRAARFALGAGLHG